MSMSFKITGHGSSEMWHSFLHSPEPANTGSDFSSLNIFNSDPWDIDSEFSFDNLLQTNPEEVGGNNEVGYVLSNLMALLSQIMAMLGKQGQDNGFPNVKGKGKGGGYGSNPDNSDESGNDHSHIGGNKNPKNVGNDYGNDPDEPDHTSGTGRPGSMPKPTGTVTVNEPIIVKAGEVFDGGGKLYKAGPKLGDGGQSEHQKPVFIIEPGGTLKNLQYEGADGIHTMGDATIKNVWNRDVGEDALTMKKPGHVKWIGGGAFNATDKIFQLNAGGSFTLENFTADNFGTAIRTNGGKNIDTDIIVKNSHFTNGKQIVRTDATATTITLEDIIFSNVKHEVLAPDGTKVVGAVNRSYKPYKG